jgi:threonylcarbamoyladenosine tRNA methylthiotransferase MtaB
MPSFCLLNFGCRASQADGAALKAQLLARGFEEAQSAGNCDVAVLNTCTVTAAADAEVRQVIRRIRRANGHCRVLVTGCYAQRTPEEIAGLEGVAWVVGNSHKHTIPDLLGGEFSSGPAARNLASSTEAPNWEDDTASSYRIRAQAELTGLGRPISPDMASSLVRIRNAAIAPAGPTSGTSHPKILVGEIGDSFHFVPAFADDRTRPTLKVQDGCDARCSFCIIPKVRGSSRSLAPDVVIDQVRRLGQAGYREIVLSGINLGGYGRDLNRSITFLRLLERILAETSIARVRISSIEPMDVTPALISLVAKQPRLARHFHVPLQSGSDRILRLMNRRYWTAQYADRMLAIREQIPGCGIGADVMVGFPSETENDHDTSLRFIDSLPLTYAHVFPYSQRPNTAAAAMANQVNGRVSHERAHEIRATVDQKRRAFLDAQAGQVLSVLTLHQSHEHNGGKGDQASVLALTSNYLRMLLPGAMLQPNTLLDAQVIGIDACRLLGTPLN